LTARLIPTASEAEWLDATEAAPDPRWAMKSSLEGFGFAAEELTRLDRYPTHDGRRTHG
jgi:hypothetical protein